MKQLREYIKSEIKRLGEQPIVKRPLPNDVKQIIFSTLRMKKGHIDSIRAIKSIRPSYRIFLNNGQSFTISDLGNGFGFGLINISNKDYDILDGGQLMIALKALNSLQTKPIMSTGDAEGGGGEEETPEETPEEEPEETEA